MRRRWSSVLFWSVISAAFIGPGTVTTCAAAGAGYGTALVWALLFSTVACIVLQEAATRVAVATGKDLGAALSERFDGPLRFVVIALVLGAIVVATAFPCDALVAGLAHATLKRARTSPTLQRWRDRVAGSVLIAVGAWVAVTERPA